MSLTPRLALIASLALTGCIDPITPVSLQLQLESRYVQNSDGTCTARISMLASGIGTATWEQVTLSLGGVPQVEYAGAEVEEFWGAPTISAGQVQESSPITISATSSADYTLLMRYAIAGTTRDMSVRMDCASQS